LPTAISIELEAIRDGELPWGNSIYLHGMLFSLIKENNEELSETLHELKTAKPFTISNISGKNPAKGLLKIHAGHKYTVRLTFLKDEVFIAAFETIYKYYQQQRQVNVSKIPMYIKKIMNESTESYENLINRELNKNTIELTFLSPTCFKVEGRNYILPDTKLVLKSYFDKWNFFSKYKISNEELHTITSNCYLTKHKLQSAYIDFTRYQFFGFIGSCTYTIEKTKLNNVDMNRLAWMLGFSKYCGTGYKTTMGMGQTSIRL